MVESIINSPFGTLQILWDSAHSALIYFPKWQSWDRQRPEEAISILRKGIEDKFPWYKRDFNRKTTTAPKDQVCL